MSWGEFAARGGNPVKNFREYLGATIDAIPNEIVSMPEVRRERNRIDLVAAGIAKNEGIVKAHVAVGTVTTPRMSGLFVDLIRPGWKPGTAIFVPHGSDFAYNRVGMPCEGDWRQAASLFDALGTVVDTTDFDAATTAVYAEMLSDASDFIGVFLPEA